MKQPELKQSEPKQSEQEQSKPAKKGLKRPRTPTPYKCDQIVRNLRRNVICRREFETENDLAIHKSKDH